MAISFRNTATNSNKKKTHLKPYQTKILQNCANLERPEVNFLTQFRQDTQKLTNEKLQTYFVVKVYFNIFAVLVRF